MIPPDRWFRALEAARAYRQADPADAARQLAQAQHFVALDRVESGFAPLNSVLATLNGVHFGARLRGRSNLIGAAPHLIGLGYNRFGVTDDGFDRLYDAYEADCRALDPTATPSRIGDMDPRAGKTFWTLVEA
ncbi:hypothetical protein LCGC14_2544190 [marine sediment metagenome]|uniref:Uncharacterized protein n=1 Tax=marine sediment metagenome TaxID=412755 RepID=A0A0F9DHW2_9ZZZZ